MSDGERRECVDCERVVAVNKDGSLRKHQCVDGPEIDMPAEPEPKVVTSPPVEPLQTTSAQPEELHTTTRAAQWCRVDRCTRPALSWAGGLCGAHWSVRPDLRKG